MSRTNKPDRRWLPATVFTLAALVMPGAAQALFTVNFDVDGNGDPIANGQIIDDEYTLANGGIVDSDSGATVGMTVSTVNTGGGPDYGVAFDTSLSGTADPDLQDPFTDITQSDPNDTDPELRRPGNILIIQENSTGCAIDGICDNPDDEAGGPNTFTFVFTDAVTLFSLDLFDVDGGGNQEEEVTMVLKDSANSVLDTFYNTGTGGDNTAARVEFGSGVMNVSMLEVTFKSSGALSNIKGAIPTVSVPAPGTLVLLALGLAGAVVRARRRQRG